MTDSNEILRMENQKTNIFFYLTKYNNERDKKKFIVLIRKGLYYFPFRKGNEERKEIQK